MLERSPGKLARYSAAAPSKQDQASPGNAQSVTVSRPMAPVVMDCSVVKAVAAAAAAAAAAAVVVEWLADCVHTE